MARGREYEEWGKEGRRKKGGRGRKKEISSERDAPSSQRSESASSTHRPYTIVFTRSRRSVPFTPLPFVSHARINRTHSRTPGCSVLEPPPRVLLAHGSVSPPPLEKKKKRNTRSADQPTFNTGTIGLLRQPPSSASHLP